MLKVHRGNTKDSRWMQKKAALCPPTKEEGDIFFFLVQIPFALALAKPVRSTVSPEPMDAFWPDLHCNFTRMGQNQSLGYDGLDLIFKGTGPQRLSNFTCLHHISWANWWNLVKWYSISLQPTKYLIKFWWHSPYFLGHMLPNTINFGLSAPYLMNEQIVSSVKWQLLA